MNFASITRRLPSLSWLKRASDPRVALGRRGERAARRRLRRLRHRILARNYRCPLGEIDIISVDGDTVVFSEVKSRSASAQTPPDQLVRRAQWLRIERAARYFQMERCVQERPFRFDLLSIEIDNSKKLTVEHFENAFQPSRR